MKIEPHTIKVRDLVAGYRNDEEEGVVAYGLKPDTPEPEIVSHLFKLYANLAGAA